MITVKQLPVLHRYYKITKFYPFLKTTAYKALWITSIFFALIIGLEVFLIDINSLLNRLVLSFDSATIYILFFISESLLGLLPPEIFIAWASKGESQWIGLLILATLSYAGGMVSYFIGWLISLIPSVKNYFEQKIRTHLINLRKWGGFFIFVGATLPIPHSVVSMGAGLIKFSFGNYLLWALFRFLRFGLYALIIYQLV